MKILIFIGAVLILLILGLAWLMSLGTSTHRQVIAEIADGPDRLTLNAVHTTDWGNAYTARTLLFNDKLVDFRGSLFQQGNEANKYFPLDTQALRVDVLDSTRAEILHQAERLFQNSTFLEGRAPYDLLKQHYPNLENGSPWTIWVKPKDFSEAEYQRLIALLRQHATALREQQQRFENDTIRTSNQWLKFPPFIIWRTVYHDYSSLKSEIFERKNGKTEEKVTITPHGAVEYHQKSERYEFGYGCGLGQLNENADTLFVSKMWETGNVSFPINEFTQFKDAKGRTLTEVYKVVIDSK